MPPASLVTFSSSPSFIPKYYGRFGFSLPTASSSRFKLEVLAPLNRTVISNTPVMMSNEETITLPSGKERRRRWRFAETPVMSTYLLALVRLAFSFPTNAAEVDAS